MRFSFSEWREPRVSVDALGGAARNVRLGLGGGSVAVAEAAQVQVPAGHVRRSLAEMQAEHAATMAELAARTAAARAINEQQRPWDMSCDLPYALGLVTFSGRR